MSWGTKRRNTIIFIFLSVVFIALSIYLFNILYKPANCFDNQQNANEAGVDCGGDCQIYCEHQILDPVVRWSRYFQVAPGVYNVVAYVENPNPRASVEVVDYEFGIYDYNNALLQTRRDTTSLPPKAIVPIIGNSLTVGKLLPDRVSFKFTNQLIWEKEEPEIPVLFVEDERLSYVKGNPRIVANIKNTEIVPIDEVTVVAIVYDNTDNAIGVSSTIFPRIPANGKVEAFFSWPNPFSNKIARFEVVPVYDRFSY